MSFTKLLCPEGAVTPRHRRRTAWEIALERPPEPSGVEFQRVNDSKHAVWIDDVVVGYLLLCGRNGKTCCPTATIWRWCKQHAVGDDLDFVTGTNRIWELVRSLGEWKDMLQRAYKGESNVHAGTASE